MMKTQIYKFYLDQCTEANFLTIDRLPVMPYEKLWLYAQQYAAKHDISPKGIIVVPWPDTVVDEQ